MGSQPSNEQYLDASSQVYGNGVSVPSGLRPFEVDGVPVTQTITADGFSASAFITDEGQVIVAFEGTSPHLTPYGIGTVLADGSLVSGQDPNSFTDASGFTLQVLQQAASQGISSSNVFVTGHSLGGAEAQFVASTMTLGGGVTFAAPGIPVVGEPTATPASAVINYVNPGDPVGNFATDTGEILVPNDISHYGSVVQIGGGSDGNLLDSSGYALLNGNLSYASIALSLSLYYHSLSNYDELLTPTVAISNSGDQDTPYDVLISLDAPLGTSGSSDLENVIITNSDTVSTPDFTIYDNPDGSFTVIQNQSLVDGTVAIDSPLGGVTFEVDPNTLAVSSSAGTNTNGSVVTVDYGSTGQMSEVELNRLDGTSQLTAYDSAGDSIAVSFSGSNGTGTPGAAIITIGTAAPNQTVLDVGEIAYDFGVARTGSGFLTTSVPLTIVTGNELVAGFIPEGSSTLFSAGQLVASGIGAQSDFGVGSYAAGAPGSIYFQEDNINATAGTYQDVAASVTFYAAGGNVPVNFEESATLYNIAQFPSISILNFGPIHVGDTSSLTFNIENTATGALTDVLVGGSITFSAKDTLAAFQETGTLDVAAGGSGALTVSLDALHSGNIADIDAIVLTSHDSYLPDVPIPLNEGVGAFATIYNYATADLEIAIGPGSLQHNGNTLTLDLGTISSSDIFPLETEISLTNKAAMSSYSDLLGGGIQTIGSSLNVSGITGGTINTEGAGFSSDTLILQPNIATIGINTETLIISPVSIDSFSTTSLPAQTILVRDVVEAACYAAGTRIATPTGNIAIESLRVGDHVVTASGRAAPVTWLGRRLVNCQRHPSPESVWPVCVKANAFQLGLPARDLWLSPDHAISANGGALIPIKHLINSTTILQTRVNEVAYWHVELECHAVILAEGLPAESYLDTGNRAAFENGAAFMELHPDVSPKSWSNACLPLVVDGLVVAAERRRLATRAREIHGVTVQVNGRTIHPVRIRNELCCFLIPSGIKTIVIAGAGLWRTMIEGGNDDSITGWRDARMLLNGRILSRGNFTCRSIHRPHGEMADEDGDDMGSPIEVSLPEVPAPMLLEVMAPATAAGHDRNAYQILKRA